MLLSPRTHVEAFLELEDLWEWTPMRTPYPSVHLALPEHPNWPVRVNRMVRVFSDTWKSFDSYEEHFVLLCIPITHQGLESI